MFGDVAAWGFGMAFPAVFFGVAARDVEELCGFAPLVCQPDCGVRNLFDRGWRWYVPAERYRACWWRICGESKNEGFVVAAIVFAVFKHVGRYLFNPINRLFCITQPYVEPSCASGYGSRARLRC